ncbi:hypothetical protein LCGC14_0389320 [marine sediment metagenome]|uniref:Uncharacterized protein n=1 Tax=marine sediment metagenome TaxID=412755 RepID=A0A0F9SZZ3_9ZZZZ
MTEDSPTNHLSVSFGDKRRYTYLNTDLSIKVGDEVLIPGGKTPVVMQVGMILDPRAPFEYKSIIRRVSRETGPAS